MERSEMIEKKENKTGKTAGERRRSRLIFGFVLLAVLLVGMILLNLNSGSVDISPLRIFEILFQHDVSDSVGTIIWSIRLPRLLAAILLGGALSVSGFLLQTFFANPIAGPFVLGISSGAKFVVALVMVLCLSRGISYGSLALVLAAFAGSLMATGFILLISSRVKNMAVLIICGVMIGYICSAVTEFLVTFADDSNIVNLHNWSMGSFSGMSWSNVLVIAIVSLAGLLGAFLLSKPMNAYQMGENYARNLGVNIRLFRAALILLSSVLSACVTAFAGPISFVGIAVPHLMKNLFNTSKPLVIIPSCFLGGAVFCALCDWIARTAFAPTEISISSVTAVFGAPIVIWIMLSRHGRKGGRA